MPAAAVQPTLIIIAGPTAAGKTSAAIAVAKHYQTEIISADSRQCYRELKIGVARPSDEQLNEIPHHFVASHSIHDEVNASVFESYALERLEAIFKKNEVAVMTGGTGLYIKAITEGLDDIPSIDPAQRKRINESYAEKGLAWLQEELAVKDPAFYEQGETRNPQRMLRALEVIESTGQSILSFRKGKKAIRPFNILKKAIELPKGDLHRNIDHRVEQMIATGLVEEARGLIPFKDLNALQTVGYAEIFEFLEGRITLETAIAQIKTNTRQYAKRQHTWFRKDKNFEWSSAGELVAKGIHLNHEGTKARRHTK